MLETTRRARQRSRKSVTVGVRIFSISGEQSSRSCHHVAVARTGKAESCVEVVEAGGCQMYPGRCRPGCKAAWLQGTKTRRSGIIAATANARTRGVNTSKGEPTSVRPAHSSSLYCSDSVETHLGNIPKLTGRDLRHNERGHQLER